MKKKSVLIYLIGMLLLLSLTFISYGQSTTDPAGTEIKRGGTLTIALGHAAYTLNNYKDVGTGGVYVLRNVFESLVEMDAEGNIVPQLAESLPEIVDGKDFVFKLREGVKFHDGTDFNAEAVKFSYDTLLNPNHSVHAQRLSAFIEGVEVLGPYKVKIVMKVPWVDLLLEMGHWSHLSIMSPTAYKKWGEDYGTRAGTLAGTGPFKITDFVRGERTILERNENYWDPELPYLDKIVIREMREAASRSMAFRTGEADVLWNVPFSDLKSLESLPGVKRYSCGGGTVHFLCFNTTKEPFNDKRVRQAISLAINRQEIVDVAFQGCAKAAVSIWPSWNKGYQEIVSEPPYDPDKAKELLAEAGFNENNPLKFRIDVRDGEIYRNEALLIQSHLEAIGVKTELAPTPPAALSTLMQNADYEAAVQRLGYGAGITNFSYRTYSSQSYLNRSKYNMKDGYKNPGVDDMLTHSCSTIDENEFARMNADIARAIFLEDVPMVTLAFEDNINLAYDYVKNWEIHAGDYLSRRRVWLNK